ncbi:hypothetical protein ABIA33_001439 [Streptacidiphilus sp. MAP12-16]|uniref:hypothetical protein n=1 Tax=Streptacidiphilus sp. MAP12-16 TaxID=3156300 RepID=UPI003519B5A6
MPPLESALIDGDDSCAAIAALRHIDREPSAGIAFREVVVSNTMGGNLGKTNDLWAASQSLVPGQSVSTIAWVGYDAPQSIVPDAISRSYVETFRYKPPDATVARQPTADLQAAIGQATRVERLVMREGWCYGLDGTCEYSSWCGDRIGIFVPR